MGRVTRKFEKITQFFEKYPKQLQSFKMLKYKPCFSTAYLAKKCYKFASQGVTHFFAISSFQKIAMSLQELA
jgi:hypothetical protein